MIGCPYIGLIPNRYDRLSLCIDNNALIRENGIGFAEADYRLLPIRVMFPYKLLDVTNCEMAVWTSL